MSTEVTKPQRNLPKLSDLVEDTEMSIKDNQLTVLLNQPPPEQWLSEHPMIKGYKYLSVQRVEWLMTRIYGKYQTIVKDVKVLANSVTVTVSVSVTNPVTGELEYQDGVGACPIQTDKGAGAMDWNFAKSDGVMKALPAAKSYAFKDACESFGKIFGKDLGRKDSIGYDMLLKEQPQYDWEVLGQLFEIKCDANLVPKSEFENLKRIITNQETTSYLKTQTYLTKLK
jgi:hypothetical protein